MGDLIAAWAGKAVSVTLRVGGLATTATVDGTLTKVNEAGVLLRLPKGLTFVPISSTLHISHFDGR